MARLQVEVRALRERVERLEKGSIKLTDLVDTQPRYVSSFEAIACPQCHEFGYQVGHDAGGAWFRCPSCNINFRQRGWTNA